MAVKSKKSNKNQLLGVEYLQSSLDIDRVFMDDPTERDLYNDLELTAEVEALVDGRKYSISVLFTINPDSDYPTISFQESGGFGLTESKLQKWVEATSEELILAVTVWIELQYELMGLLA